MSCGVFALSLSRPSLSLSLFRALVLCGRSPEVDIILMVCFVSILLLSYPTIRLIVRVLAYVVTTWAPGVLYRGNR